jgi:hypothetical protein
MRCPENRIGFLSVVAAILLSPTRLATSVLPYPDWSRHNAARLAANRLHQGIEVPH